MHGSVVDRFFHAFRRRDGEAMASCYHPRAVFRDPVFGRLEGERIGAMWRMLTSGASTLDVTVLDTSVEGDRAWARWVAVYPFGATGRVVRNEVRSEFEFDHDLVIVQEDVFSFPAWARQALGGAAIPFAWLPVYRRRVSSVANAQLDRFLAGGAGAA
jgi:hypothetical protein